MLCDTYDGDFRYIAGNDHFHVHLPRNFAAIRRDLCKQRILMSFHLSEEDGKRYGVIKEMFESQLIKRHNKIYVQASKI